MGGANSVLSTHVQRHCSSEFTRLCAPSREFLVLSELRQLESIEDLPVDIGHLGTLWVLDSDRDGRVTLNELLQFAALCAEKRRDFKEHEFTMQLQGFCTLRMFDQVSEQGEEAFVEWFSALFSEGAETATFPDYSSDGAPVEFLGRSAAHLTHEVLQIDANYGCDMQKFFDLVQRSGEAMGIMSLEDERLDELVPVVVLRRFARFFIRGFLRLMHSNLRYDPLPAAPPPRADKPAMTPVAPMSRGGPDKPGMAPIAPMAQASGGGAGFAGRGPLALDVQVVSPRG
ncbi:hypothetical protein T484DRAFT_1933558 [Baffinella frigidus]|nr:hypothetical protein T484DRAFT_1933558 [Cryptophyta sp. CCMP2293]|mmetsp:Transcript_8172/g.19932  ORF Transcript_8172/g.19932 Transcript_8172/m.19932 type:complete len:286 (+) Transcript_8172:80-937(+)